MKRLMCIVLVGISFGSIPCLAQRKELMASLRNSINFQDDKVKIKKEELPDPVRKTLENDAFKGWIVMSAYKLKSGDYEVELKKGDTTQSLKFDKEGKAKQS